VISESWRSSAPLALNFARRELKTRYRRSVLGWVWSLLNPISTVIVYSLVFSVFLRAEPDPAGNGDKVFALYLFCGLVPWMLFAGMLNGSMQWLDGIAELRRKVYFPPEAAIFGSALALVVQASIEMIVLVLAFVVIGNVSPTIVLYPIVLLSAGTFGLGLGFIVAVFNARLRDVQYLVGIVLNIMFFLTPIMYPAHLIPDSHWGVPIRALLDLNPMVHIVGAARDTSYLLEWPSLSRWAWLVIAPALAFSVGWTFFNRRAMELSERL